MLNVNIFGSYRYDDLPNIPVASLVETDLYSQIQAYAAAESSALQELISSIADFGTSNGDSFGVVSGGQLQRAGQGARPEATRRGGKFTVYYPIYAYEDRKIYTPEYLEQAKLSDLNADIVDSTIKDVASVYMAVFNAFTQSTNYTFDDDPWPGNRSGQVTIRRLANNDGQSGSVVFNGNQTQLATLNNYIVSGAAAYALGAFTTARTKLKSTGNGDDIVHVVSSNDGDTLATLLGADFIARADPNLSILPTTQVPILQSPKAIGRVRTAGEVQVWPHWPDGYMFSYDRSKDRPVRIRQHPDAAKRGFRLVADETRGGERPGRPLVNKYWQRIMGAAVRNRFNGVMTKITTGAWSDPVIA